MKLNISRDVLAEIGTISVVHSLIEDELAELITELLGLSRATSHILTTELSFGQRVAVVSSLFLHALGPSHPFARRLKDVLKAVGDAEAQRNTALHALWFVPVDPSGPDQVLRVKRSARARRGLVEDYRRFTLAELKAITEQQGRAFADLARFREALRTTAIDGTTLDPSGAA